MEFLIVKMFSRHELKLTGEMRNPLEPWHSYETAKKDFPAYLALQFSFELFFSRNEA